MRGLSVLCLVSILASLTAVEALPVEISATDKHLSYLGRFTSDLRCAWSGSCVRFTCNGGPINLVVTNHAQGPHKNYIGVVVDDGEEQGFVLDSGQQLVRIVDKLPRGGHQVTVFKRSEGYRGAIQFGGLQLAKGVKLGKPPAHSKRRILVVGDSISAGMGLLGAAGANDDQADQTPWYTYWAVASRAVGADAMCVATSGKGIYRNWGSEGASADTMPTYFDQILTGDGSQPWDHSQWVPTDVIINLNTNDFGTGTPPKDEFLAAYRDFLMRIRETAPQARIYLALGPMIDAEKRTLLTGWYGELIAALGDRLIAVADLGSMQWPAHAGGTSHPNRIGHAAAAENLVRFLGGAKRR